MSDDAKQGLKLLRIDFDNTENRSELALVFEEIGIFVNDPEPGKRAHVKVQEALAVIETEKLRPYLGWNDEVYPKFVVRKVELK